MMTMIPTRGAASALLLGHRSVKLIERKELSCLPILIGYNIIRTGRLLRYRILYIFDCIQELNT
jgi:hypothetical protein